MVLDLSSLTNALAALERGLARYQVAPTDEELRDACIQRFEFTFELSWRMVKRRLEMDLPDAQGVDAMSYRTLIRAGAELGLIDDVPAWFVYREKRNITSHAYDARQGRGRRGGAPGVRAPRAATAGAAGGARPSRCLT